MRLSARHLVAAALALFPAALPADPAAHFRLTGDYLAVSTVADRVEGAQYTRQYINPSVLAIAGGGRIWGPLYLGLRVENWFAGRAFVNAQGTAQTDTLTYRTLGIETGYMTSSPRVIYLATLGVQYPLAARVTSRALGNTDEYSASGTPLAYALRMALGIRFSRVVSLSIEGGYRFANLGQLATAHFTYLGTEPFDLSGAFAAIGLGVSIFP